LGTVKTVAAGLVQIDTPKGAVKKPMATAIESLSVSTAAAIALYAVARRRL
jgi:tRNA G18 (ribose-2'-O)-methylase SpoU